MSRMKRPSLSWPHSCTALTSPDPSDEMRVEPLVYVHEPGLQVFDAFLFGHCLQSFVAQTVRALRRMCTCMQLPTLSSLLTAPHERKVLVYAHISLCDR